MLIERKYIINENDEFFIVYERLHEEKEMWKRECQRLKGMYYLENEKVELNMKRLFSNETINGGGRIVT